MKRKYIILFIIAILLVILIPLVYIFRDQILEYIPIFNKQGNTQEEDKKIVTKSTKGVEYRMVTPLPNSEVDCTFDIEGEIPGSWFFEGVFPITLVSDAGAEILTVQAKAVGDSYTDEFVKFTAEVTCTDICNGDAKLVFIKDNPSGEVANDDSFEIPIFFKELCDIDSTMSLLVYFGNTMKDPNSENCEKVYAVSRKVVKTEAVGRAALLELLKGTTSAEEDKGYISSIPAGVTINSLKISKGVAYVDFNEKLGEGVGGACLVERIRGQITQTLKQFSTVDKVVISINGESEDILQP
ncbi:MAG TPA: GerMN domain-containing protein [Candidatus Dojkabacteria bacterium]|nr:GerMN domain-containing protein [Candidatus Dojkabacteria bacterium]